MDVGLGTDTSSYGADGQDEEGGLPEDYEVRLWVPYCVCLAPLFSVPVLAHVSVCVFV